MESLLAISKDFGFPVALCVVLLLAIRWQNAQLVKAYASIIKAQGERIETLEAIYRKQESEIRELQNDRLRRTDQYATDLKDAAARYVGAVRDFHRWMEQAWRFIVERCGLAREYHPHSAPPTPPEPPRPGTGVVGSKL